MATLVIYHAGCWDGFCAAWIAHKIHPDAEFFPCNYGMEPPDVTGKDVFILDFSFKRPVLLAMKEKAKSLLVLDHHKTAQTDLEGLDFCRFDMSKSGGRMAWEHFFLGKPSPWLVDYTEDRDLWRHALPNTKEINAALRVQPLDFEEWDWMGDHRDAALTDLTPRGCGILEYQDKLIASHVEHAQEIEILGHRVLATECTCADITSEVAGELAKNRPFGVCWFEMGNERVYSLRSREGGVDVSEVAKQHGGGGHKNAAGFKVPATGATGIFSEGQQVPEDEGDLRVAIAADKKAGLVQIDFGKKVAWVSIGKAGAMDLADLIREKAMQL